MAKALQSIEFTDKNDAVEWLSTNHYDPSKIKQIGKKWVYTVRPKATFQPRTEQISEVGNIKFVYGRYKITPVGKKRDTIRLKEKKKTEAEILVNALRPYLDKEIPIAGVGSGVQSVRVPRKWGKEKAGQWVAKKGWTADYWGKSPFTETPNWLRYRQYAPKKEDEYRIKTLPNKVQLVYSNDR